jgi:hypothetical protein
LSRRKRLEADRPARGDGRRDYPSLNVALDLCCEGGPDGPVHASHRVWRFLMNTFEGSPTPEQWTDAMVVCRTDRQGALPAPYEGGQVQAEWTATDGRVWIPVDCVICGRETEVPLSWVREQLATVWQLDAQRVIRRVLTRGVHSWPIA